MLGGPAARAGGVRPSRRGRSRCAGKVPRTTGSEEEEEEEEEEEVRGERDCIQKSREMRGEEETVAFTDTKQAPMVFVQNCTFGHFYLC